MQKSRLHSKSKKFSNSQITVTYIVEHTLGCRWMLEVLKLLRAGTNRPGAMVRCTDGMSTKVLNERLAELSSFGIVKRNSYPEVPPRVEYELTEFGHQFVRILDLIEELESYRR